MLKKSKRLLRTGKRQFSLFTKYPKIAEQLKLYRENQDILKSDDFKQLEKILKFDYEMQEVRHKFEKKSRELLLTEADYVSKLLDLYFKTRSHSKHSERLLLTLLKMLFINSRVSENWTPGTDIGPATLYSSEKFLAVLKDIRILATRNYAGNYSVSKTIIDNLRGLRYKSFDIIKLFCNKIYFELFNEEYLPGTFDSLQDLNKVHMDGLVHERLDKILNSEQFVGFMNRVLNIVEFNPHKEYNQNYIGDNTDIEEFENAVDMVTKTLGSVRENYLKLFDAVCQLRDYYMKLKEPEKFVFIKDNPHLLLDFLSLEEHLIQAGVIMPKDVVSNTNTEEITGLILEQFVLQQGYDEDYLSNLFKVVEKSSDKNEAYKRYSEIGQLKKREDLFRLIFTLVDYVSFKAPYVDLSNVYIDPKFDDIFDRIIPKTFPNEFISKMQYLMENNYRYIDVNTIGIANYYFTKPYVFLRTFFNDVCNRINFESESPRALFYLNSINKKLLISHKDISSLNNVLLTANIDHEFLIDILSVYKSLEPELLYNLMERYVKQDLFDFIQDKFLDFSTKFSYKILLAQFLVMLKLNSKFAYYHSTIDSLLVSLIKEEYFEYYMNTDRKRLLPLTDEKPTVMMVFHYFKVEFADYIEKEGLTAKLDQTLQFLCNNINLNWEAGYYYDPVYVQVFNALKNRYAEESDLTCLCYNYKDELPEDVHPHFLFNNGDKLVGVYLLSVEDSEVKGDFYFKKRLVEHLFKKKFGIDMEIRQIDIRKLFKNQEYFVNCDFALKENTDYIEEVMKMDGDLNLNKSLNNLNRILNDPKNFQTDKLDSLNTIKSYINKINTSINKFGMMNQTLCTESIGQLKFLIHLLTKLTNSNETRTYLNTISSGLTSLESGYEISESKTSKYPFEGIRIGLGSYKSNGYFSQKSFELLNYKFFKNTQYHVIEEWKDELKQALGPLNYHESDQLFATNLTRIQQVLLPKVGGRKLINLDDFSLYWDYKAMGTEKEQNKAEIYNNLLKAHNNSSLTETQNYKIALLNLMYEIRTIEKFDDFFERLFNLPFWNKYIERLTSDNNKEVESVYTDTIISNVIYNKTQIYDEYREKMEQFKNVHDKIRYYQKLINEIIPREYSNATEEHYKTMIYDYWNKVKNDYGELLVEYKDNFAEEYKTHNNTPYKDIVNTLIYKHDDNKTDSEIVVSDNNQGLMLKLLNNILKLYIMKTSLKDSSTELLRNKHFDLIEKQGFLSDIDLTEKLINIPIEEVFTKEDYEFFDLYLNHSKLSNVNNHGLSDLLITLSFAVDARVVEANEMKHYVENVYKLQSADTDATKKAIISLFDNRMNNSSRFAHDYAQNYIHQKSMNITDNDRKHLEDILKIMRSNLIR